MSIEKDIQDQPAAKKALDAEQEQQLADLEKLTGEDYSPPEPRTAVQERDAGPDLDTAQMCTSVVSVIFTLVAGRRGDHWQLSGDEGQQLGGALAAVLDKYAPEFKGGPEATLVLVALMIAGPRAMMDAKIREQQLEQEQQPADKSKEKDARPASRPVPVPEKDWIQDKAA